MSCPIRFHCLILIVVLFFSCAPQKEANKLRSTVSAPGSSGANSISGRVTDEKGAPLPGVSLTLESRSLRLTAVTSAGGAFTFANLPVATYTLTASLSGFTELRQEGITLSPNQSMQVDFTLGSSPEEVLMVSGAPAGGSWSYDGTGISAADADELIVIAQADEVQNGALKEPASAQGSLQAQDQIRY